MRAKKCKAEAAVRRVDARQKSVCVALSNGGSCDAIQENGAPGITHLAKLEFHQILEVRINNSLHLTNHLRRTIPFRKEQSA
jgi:hypothetical protein